MFGLVDGFKFWFSWEIITPIQQFIHLNITHKTYCTWCGWYCKEDCKHEKITTKAEILKHWEESTKEMNTVEKGDNDFCVYCNDEKGTEKISNPNSGELSRWLVCKDCKEVLKYQMQFTMAQHLGAQKQESEALNKLDNIAKRTGKPIMIAGIIKTKKGYKTSSIEFTGENET